MKRKEIIIGAIFVGLIFLGIIYNKKPQVIAEDKKNVEEIISSDITVQVIGEVNKPGIYEIEEDSRLIDLINLAGGLTKDAVSDINLVQKLSDGMVIKIEKKGSNTGVVDSKISINNGSLAELMTLKGVGEATAKKIIDYRNTNGPFVSINDLKKVSGISEKIFNDNIESIKL